MVKEDRVTTVQMKVKTRDRLSDIGKKKETYDDIINRLLEAYKS